LKAIRTAWRAQFHLSSKETDHMNLRTSLLAATCALLMTLPLLCGAQQTAVNQDPPAESKTASPSLQVETASVEEVLATDDDGFHASTYVVRWHAQPRLSLRG
jgi:hypothetical protein